MGRQWMAALAAALLGTAAAPAERPLAVPTRDVDVVYRTAAPPGAPPLQQRVRWDVAGARQRVDPPGAGLYLILDYRAHRLSSVRDSIRSVLEIDGEAAPMLRPVGQGQYTSEGEASVAGLGCRQWLAHDGAEPPRRLCVTDDGVLLRITAGERVLLEATSVRYAPADPATFAIPPDYKHIVPTQEKAP